MQSELRKLPSVDQLLQDETLKRLMARHGRELVLDAVRHELASRRQLILDGQSAPSTSSLLTAIRERLEMVIRPSLLPVINATGVIIHTNLGRVLLSERARLAMQQAAMAYSNLEYDLAAGQRGSRYSHATELLCRLTGAESALVVNNNAGAVILVLTALAKNREVIISRGQLVEIGGGFRIPDIMAQSGAKLVEVGTTNRTYRRDFEQAIKHGETGLLLTVHHSNYQITGFTAQPTLVELATLSHRTHIPLMEDLGSGTLLDTTPFGLAHEPTIQESLMAGVSLVTASGDKLLGGPQAGLILGQADLIAKLRQHPLIRALRVDKTTLAALQATLLAYLENKAVTEIPVWQMIAADLDELADRAAKWRHGLRAALSAEARQIVDSRSTVGGGSLPGQTLPTKALAVQVSSVARLARLLRRTEPPIIVRLENDQLLLDPRTVLPAQDQQLIENCQQAIEMYQTGREDDDESDADS